MLAGRIVRLEPLGAEHDDALWEASRPPRDLDLGDGAPQTRAEFQAYLDQARAATAAGEEFAFATVDARSGRPWA